MNSRDFYILFLIVGIISTSCASVPKLNKTALLIDMEAGNTQAQMKVFKQALWRVYVINDHEKTELKGSDMVELLKISQRCYDYMQKADEMMFSEGKVNPKLMTLSADQIAGVKRQFEENLTVVCGKTLVKDDYRETAVSLFFYKYFYPYLFVRYKAGISALALLESVKRSQEQAPLFQENWHYWLAMLQQGGLICWEKITC